MHPSHCTHRVGRFSQGPLPSRDGGSKPEAVGGGGLPMILLSQGDPYGCLERERKACLLTSILGLGANTGARSSLSSGRQGHPVRFRRKPGARGATSASGLGGPGRAFRVGRGGTRRGLRQEARKKERTYLAYLYPRSPWRGGLPDLPQGLLARRHDVVVDQGCPSSVKKERANGAAGPLRLAIDACGAWPVGLRGIP